MSGDDAMRLARRALPASAVAAVGLLFIVSSLFGGVGAALGSWGSWAAAGTAATAAGSLYQAARRLPDGAADRIRRDSWRWFGIAALCWCAGATINAVSRMVLSDAVMSLSLPDLFFLAAVGALAAGFVVQVRRPNTARPWLLLAADTYMCVCAVFVLGWVAQFGRIYHDSGESPPEFLLELLSPLVGVALVCAMLPFALAAARRRAAAVAFGAFLLVAAADVVTTIVRLRGGSSAEIGAAVRVVGLLLLGAVPWVRSAEADADTDANADADVRGRVIGLGVAPAVAAAVAGLYVAGYSLTTSRDLDPVVLLVAGSAVLVVLARLAGLLRENDWLRRAVDTGEGQFRALAETINDVVLICGLDGTVQYVSAGAQRIFNYRPEEMLGLRLPEIIHPEDVPRVESVFAEFGDQKRAEGAPAPRLAFRMRAADGTWVPTESTISPYVRSDEETTGRLLITTRDLSEQAALQRQVTHLTFNDGLTGLPNRAYFEERTREVLSRVLSRQQEAGSVAVVFADLDGFTAVNDSVGHAAGDQVLAQAARRLRATVQADDTVARWGGDEFAVLVENAADGGQSVVELAERLLRVLSAEPYRVGDRAIALTASVGVAFADDDEGGVEGGASGTDAAELIRNGDLAMARAKELGGGRVEVFAAHMHADVVRRLDLGSDLQRALAERRFAVEFQPVVELSTSRVTGVEALVRWRRGSVSVPPEEFIGPAEESGLMIPLGDWVLREACGEVARWRESGWDIGVSVNFTARQVAAPRFVESVAAVLEETGLTPQALTLEVKEEVLVEDGGQNVAQLSALRELGVRLAIDDFGTGYASLAYLGQLPVDIIKIDPSFVAGLGNDDTLTLLTRTIVRLGHDLGLVVVAEGIERPEQLELLREMGCPRGQGFLVARPMPAGRAQAMVRTNLSPRAGNGGADTSLEGSALST
jgi:diguanylate cyclase (GGDEF)-like protein/PAS domain S-box-containing protein